MTNETKSNSKQYTKDWWQMKRKATQNSTLKIDDKWKEKQLKTVH